jgi:hypothetical protein
MYACIRETGCGILECISWAAVSKLSRSERLGPHDRASANTPDCSFYALWCTIWIAFVAASVALRTSLDKDFGDYVLHELG